MLVYVNGDSYSAPTDKFKVYSEFLGDKLSMPVINDAVAGASNYRIFRTTVEYIASLPAGVKPLVVIGFSFVTREEIWIDDFTKYQHRVKDYAGSQFVTLDWLQPSDITDDIKHLIVDQNINSQMVHFYTNLYMLTGLLKGLDIPYLIFSAARNVDFRNLNWNSLNNLKIYQNILNDPNILDFKTFNIPLWANQNNLTTTETGHLLDDGHVQFAEFLHSKIIYDSLR